MNMRNLLFIIVLFLVWVMGYYHYTPKHPATFHSFAPPTHGTADQPILRIEAQREVIDTPRENTPLASEQPPMITPVVEIHSEVISLEKPIEQPKKEKKKNKSKRKIKKELEQQKDTSRGDIPSVQPLITETLTPLSQPTVSHAPDANQATISITSSLVKKDIGYYKMLSWHYPHLFTLTVNDQPLFTKREKVITHADMVTIPAKEPFTIRYSYEWHTPWGKRIGAKKVMFKPNSGEQNLSVAFKSNWKQEERITVEGATKISAELLEEEMAP